MQPCLAGASSSMIPLMLAKQGLSLGLGMVQGLGCFDVSSFVQMYGSVLPSKVIIAAVVHFCAADGAHWFQLQPHDCRRVAWLAVTDSASNLVACPKLLCANVDT